jgi:nicotinate-nucleotide pyrophosphorylase
MLRRIFGRKREEVVGGWRRLHKGELHNLYSSLDIIRMITSSMMRSSGTYEAWVLQEMKRKFWSENVKVDTTRKTSPPIRA